MAISAAEFFNGTNLSSAAELARAWLFEKAPNPITLLPYLTLALILSYFLSNFIAMQIKFQNSDLSKLREPPIPPYKRYTVGHNILRHLLLDDPMEVVQLYNDWRRKYGEVYQVRSLFGAREVHIASGKGVREVNITKYASFSKSAASRAAIGPLVGEQGILFAEGEKHTRLRRAVSPAMHHEALIALGDIFLEQGRLLSERLGSTGADDVLREVRLRTFAVIFETCFGKDAASEEDVERIREAYLTVFLEPPLRSLARIICTKLFWFLRLDWLHYRKDLKAYLRKTIFELCKQAKRGERTTLLDLMVDANTQQTLAYQERVETVLSFLVAGQITTSLSVCWTLYLLARHPEWQNRLKGELSEWREEDGLDGLDALPLLNRVVRESIRLYPPVFSVPRVTNREVTIDNYRLPKGTAIRIPMLALQRSEDIWGSDVEEFNPDRFLKDGELARTKMFWCAFLFGPRGCIGQRFALLEIKAFVAQILVLQRVYLKPLQDPPPGIYGPLCTPKNLKLYFEPWEQAR